jgi:hypothetical protein
MTGGRIKRIQKYIGDEPFMMTYGDGVCDVNIEELVKFHQSHGKIATLTAVQQQQQKGVLDIASLQSIWGQDVPEPKIAVKLSIPTANIDLLSRDKNPTLKFRLSNGTSMIKFKSSEEEYEQLTSDSESVIIEAVGTCAINDFGGNISPQILIEEYEIVGKLESYF